MEMDQEPREKLSDPDVIIIDDTEAENKEIQKAIASVNIQVRRD